MEKLGHGQEQELEQGEEHLTLGKNQDKGNN